MAKIIHTADLHLATGDDKDYGLSVLDEIIGLCGAERADALVISGDLFDSFADFSALRREVCARLEPLVKAGCEVVYIPGNHESLGDRPDQGGIARNRCREHCDRPDLSKYDLKPLRFQAELPFSLLELKGVEFLCVPHAASYDNYRDWAVPAKKAGAVRVALAHALNSTIFTGPDPEDQSRAGIIDDNFFTRFAVDYAALGHVHAGRQQLLGGALACYPGSPRVWRAHSREAGQKTVRLVDTAGSPVNIRRLELKSAGQYREYALPLGPDSLVPERPVSKLILELEKPDLVTVRLSGFVDDEKAARAAADALRERLAPMVRRAAVELDTRVAAEISANSLAKAFLEGMEAARPSDGDEAAMSKWLLARQYGLEELAGRLGEGA
ncbi:MAG: DNA repair exonuclease [Elusimicrobia bacterium]|nr:MAG: DNA repair exonuclease [Elusimicrobiota bacterium]KAF0153913.1 MAG: DNA repair exonuclease [Elusimicrobiota bacterium]